MKTPQQAIKDNSDIRIEVTSEVIVNDLPPDENGKARQAIIQVCYCHTPAQRYPFRNTRRLREIKDALPEGMYIPDLASALTTNNYDGMVLNPFDLPLIPEKQEKQAVNQ